MSNKPSIHRYFGSKSAAKNAARVFNQKGHPLSGMGYRYEAQLVSLYQWAVVNVQVAR